jgi:hypothetical protein
MPVGLFQCLRSSISLVRNRDQVDMIGHEAMSDERHSVECYVLPQQVKVDRFIGIAIQDEPPPFPRCVTWSGTSTATTRVNRSMTGKPYQEPPHLLVRTQ